MAEPNAETFDLDEATGTLSDSFTGSLGSNVAANMLTLAILGLGWAVKKMCSRDVRMKSKCHTCCLDVSIADKTERSEHPPSVSVDDAPVTTV